MATRLRVLLDSALPLVRSLGSRLPESVLRRIGPLAAFLHGPGAATGPEAAAPPPAAATFTAADVPPPPPLAYADVLAWAKASGRSVRFRRAGDHFEVSAQGLRVEFAPGQWAPAPPRLALPLSGDLPAIRAEDLAPLAASGAPAAQGEQGPQGAPFSSVFKVDIGPATSWDAVASAVPFGDGGVLGDAGTLVRLGLLTAEAASEALDQARAGEPLDMVLSRLGRIELDTWAEALVGRQFLFPPASRPFKDRIGMRLLAAHAISQGQLKQALEAQAAAGPHKLLGQILGLPDTALRKALEGQNPLPGHFAEADSLGEVLIRWGCVARGDWLAAQRAGPDAAGTLIKSGKLLSGHAARARAYRDALGKHLSSRSVRLGQILVDRGLDRSTLGKALAWQVDQPLPLAELMVLHRLLAPGEAARALGQQAAAYRSLAESGLPPLEPRRPRVQPRIAPPAARPAPPRRPFPRQAYGLAVVAIFSLAWAFANGARQSGFDYGWFNLFFPTPRPTAALYRPPGGEVHDVSESEALKRRAAVQQVDRLDLPLGRGGLRVPGATGEFGQPQDAVGLAQGGPAGRPSATVDFAADPLLAGRLAPDSADLTASPPAGGPLAGTVPKLPPPRRFPAPTFGDRPPPEPLAPPSFPPLSARSLAASPNPYSYPMERAVALAGSEQPAPREPLASPAAPPGNPGEPAVMRRFRADLARLRASEAQHRKRGRDLRQEGQEDAARRELTLAENVRRSQAVFRARIGQAYWREGDLVAAAAELKGAAHDDPGFALPRYYLGAIAQAKGDHVSAAGHFRAYLELAPDGEFAPEARKALLGYGEKVPDRSNP